jgi:hypothetical protein
VASIGAGQAYLDGELLTQLVDQAPDGPDWLHEIRFDGYRMHALLDRGPCGCSPAPGSTGRAQIIRRRMRRHHFPLSAWRGR